ncbi:MAG: hypothetical protein J5959_12755, partial [Butyrivibrio sp.]|nr:hypothetical protein [Butyrivibrio sp.]
MKKKLLATLLSASMVMGIAACGSSTGTETTSTETTGTEQTAQTTDTAQSSETAQSTDTASATPVEYPAVTFMAIDFNSGASNTGDYAEQVMQTLEDHTGIDVDIQWVQSDVLEEKATLAMQDPSSMPMIMTW